MVLYKYIAYGDMTSGFLVHKSGLISDGDSGGVDKQTPLKHMVVGLRQGARLLKERKE